MPVRFTKHAKVRMRERGISIAAVFRVLANGNPQPSRGNPVWQADVDQIQEEALRQLLEKIRVVCTADLQVITVYVVTR